MKKNIAICLLIALMIGGWVYGLVRYESQSRDAYIYGVPEGARFSYTDIPMFECSWCHRTKNLNRHHIVPQSADIRLKDDAQNIIVLCRDCHFVLGHRCNWKQFNPDVIEICSTYTNVIRSAIYNAGLTNETAQALAD